MWATHKSLQAAFLGVAYSLVATATAFAQNMSLENVRPAVARSETGGTRRSECTTPLVGLRSLERFGEGAHFADGLGNEALPGRALEAACSAAPSDAPAPVTRATRPCQPLAGMKTALAGGPPCFELGAPVYAPLNLGKEGLKVNQARQEVLEILSEQNACSEWFGTKDRFPAQTFASLNIAVDKHGPEAILESDQRDGFFALRHPYVAFAIQDGGAFTTITVNGNGAFYRSQGRVERSSADGGPLRLDGMRSLTVGAYYGDTPEARVVTLLHEFGHIIDLLPQDGDDLDGSSMRNTNEVLRHCRAEVEARAQEAKSAKSHHFWAFAPTK